MILLLARPAIAAPHPHLYLTPASLAEFKGRVLADERLRAAWTRYFRESTQAPQPEEWNDRVCEQLAFSYVLLGDKRLGRAATELLLQAAEQPSWHDGHRADRAFPWHSGLRTSAFCMSVGTAYDWVYSVMTPAERETIRSALIEKGILPLLSDWSLPGARIHALDSMGHNWWAVCLSGAGVAALALLDEEPRAEEWVRDITRSLQEWFRYEGNALLNKVPNFGPDGGFYEGLNYTNYSFITFLRYAEALHSSAGEDLLSDNPAIHRLAEFLLYPAYQTEDGWLSVNFGDSPAHLLPSRSVLLDLTRRTSDPHLLWYWEEAYGEVRDAFDFLWFPHDLESKPPDDLPPARCFEGIDWAVVRDGWSPGGTLFALTCGDFWNHAHADAGSFLLYSRGKPLIIDSGSCSYSEKEYTSYYCQSEAHNVILWNGRGQPRDDRYRGSPFRGEIRGWISSPRYTYFCADATGPYASLLARNFRHVVALDGLFVLVDDLLAHESGVFSWLLHSDGETVFENQTVRITNPPAAADLQFAFPTGLTAETRSGFEEKTRKPKPYLALQTPDSSRDAKFLALLSTRSPSDPPPPPVERRQGPNWIGMRFETAAGTVDVFCNLLADGRKMHENSENNLDGFITDAFLLVLVRHGAKDIVRFGLHNGSFLRDRSGPIFESFSKADLFVENGISQIDAVVRSQKGTRILLRCPVPSQLLLDGEPVSGQPWRQAVSMQEITLSSENGEVHIEW